MIPIAFFFGGGRRTDQTAGRTEGFTVSMTIAWDDQFKRQNIMWKVPRNIRMNDNIVVREDEIAVFYRDGKVLAYLDRPDRYALTSQNAPILGNLIKALSGVAQQAEVYYLQKRIFDGKFGTQDAFLFQDPDFDMVQLRAVGDLRYRIKDPEALINPCVGTFGATPSEAGDGRGEGARADERPGVPAVRVRGFDEGRGREPLRHRRDRRRPRGRHRDGVRDGLADGRDDRPRAPATDEAVPQVRHPERREREVLRQLRDRHGRPRVQRAW